MTRSPLLLPSLALVIAAGACHRQAETSGPRASGYVEATEVRLASKVAGRVETVAINEGARIAQGDVAVTLSTTETDLAVQRARAERAALEAQLRLLQAGPRTEDVRQAEAQVTAASGDQKAAQSELESARVDETRFQQLLDKKAGTTKQRDDATARRELAEARTRASADRVSVASATLDRVKAGARPEELDAARARIAAVDADLATLEQKKRDAVIVAPTSGIVTSRLVEPGELVAVGAPLVVLIDLDRAWVNAYVEEPLVPSLKIDQSVTVVTDAGQQLKGKIAFIAPKAEFTPRNVQTSAERAKLVYRVKVTIDNREGVLKPGMPVDVRLADGGGK